ncbi:MAG TPA: electron transport complex subunit RsxC [Spirochaetia bacterium]|nr:electron transport complex subunit RsxC [Spirochaetales bacterium]HRW25095.1 electron transport complex subunit RsxC [Spirochaetia bacterium]
MATKTFKGGTHPPERKERSASVPIQTLRNVSQVVIPVNQHFGAPIQPLVKVGDQVKRGQKIADADGRMTVPLHASVYGTVKKIEPRMQANNLEGLAIVIEPLPGDEAVFMPTLDPFACTKEEALARVREAGIIGVGGAGFPAHVKFAPPPNKPIEYVIANAAECEPYLTIDERVMEEHPGDFIDGIAIVMKIVGATKGVVGLEDNKAQLVPALEKAIAAKSSGMDIRVQLLKTKYPQGGEKMLITAVTGREVPSGGLPMDVGCVVSNVNTLLAVSEAFRKGQPVIDTGLTVTGGACETPKNLFVPVGMLVQDLFPDVARYDEKKLRRIVMGGPMMGPAVPSMLVPIQKNTSGVLLMDESEAKAYGEGPCIRCGRCMRACSCRLSPALLNVALKAGDLDEAERIGVMDCIECGTCSFVCPSHIQLVQRFRVGKQLVRAKKQKEAQRAGK